VGWGAQLDIMDRGTNARNFLLGTVVPLRLGYVGVVNRSQEVRVQFHFLLRLFPEPYNCKGQEAVREGSC
jgi:dynamin 1-like protein